MDKEFASESELKQVAAHGADAYLLFAPRKQIFRGLFLSGSHVVCIDSGDECRQRRTLFMYA